MLANLPAHLGVWASIEGGLVRRGAPRGKAREETAESAAPKSYRIGVEDGSGARGPMGICHERLSLSPYRIVGPLCSCPRSSGFQLSFLSRRAMRSAATTAAILMTALLLAGREHAILLVDRPSNTALERTAFVRIIHVALRLSDGATLGAADYALVHPSVHVSPWSHL